MKDLNEMIVNRTDNRERQRNKKKMKKTKYLPYILNPRRRKDLENVFDRHNRNWCQVDQLDLQNYRQSFCRILQDNIRAERSLLS